MKTLAIDFDGVIHKYSKGWNGGAIYDDPVTGAGTSLKALSKTYKIVIFTARTDLEPVVEWMTANFPEVIDIITITNQKPPAAIYIDDRALRFTSWVQALVDINSIMRKDKWQQFK